MKKKSGNGIKNDNMFNKELAEELHKPIMKTLNKIKVHSPFIDNICGSDLADIQLISKFNKWFRFLSCLIDILSKYTWVFPLKDKKEITITNAFQKFWKESNRKPSKIWVDKGSECYNRLMYSRHNEEKSAVAERYVEP